MDVHTPEQRSKNMLAIKATGTKDEVRLAKALWHLGYRYSKNDKSVFGKPDLFSKNIKLLFLSIVNFSMEKTVSQKNSE